MIHHCMYDYVKIVTVIPVNKLTALYTPPVFGTLFYEAIMFVVQCEAMISLYVLPYLAVVFSVWLVVSIWTDLAIWISTSGTTY